MGSQMKFIHTLFLVTLLFSGCGGGSSAPAPSHFGTVATSCIPGSPIQNLVSQDYFPTEPSMYLNLTGVDGTAWAQTITSTLTFTGPQIILGQKVFDFQTSTSVSNTSPSTSITKFVVNANGVQDWSDYLRGALPFPIDLAVFPIETGKVCTQSFGNLLLVDIDLDGKPEKTSFQIKVTSVGKNPVTVAAGSFPESIQLKTEIVQLVELSSNGLFINARAVTNDWWGKKIGLIKRTYRESSTYNGSTSSYNFAEEMNMRYSIPNFATNDIQGDPYSDNLYFSGSANSPYADSIGVYDTYTRQVSATIPLPAGGDPGPMALTRDGKLLYVGLTGTGQVAPVSLPSKVVGTPFSLGMSPAPRAYLPREIAISPVDPYTLAVAMADQPPSLVPVIENVGIYNNGTPLPSTLPNSLGNLLFDDTGTALYAALNSLSDDFYDMAVSNAGVTLTASYPYLLTTLSPVFVNKLAMRRVGNTIYSANGKALDLTTFLVSDVFNFNVPNAYVNTGLDVLVDAPGSTIFYLTDIGIISVNMTTNAYNMHLTIGPDSPLYGFFGTTSGKPCRLTRIGTNHFAFLNKTTDLVIIYENALLP